MTSEALKFLVIVLCALALVPAGAHLMELPNKIRLPAEEYLTVQQLYRGWALSGVLVVAALLATIVLAFSLRGQRGFMPALVACLSIAGTQAVFWTFTYPVNSATRNWTVLPENWQQLRVRWECSHAASALLNLGALIASTAATLRAP
jgi:hypothetical protein